MKLIFLKSIRILFILVSLSSVTQAMVDAYEREVEGALSAYMQSVFLTAYETCSGLYQTCSNRVFPPDLNTQMMYRIRFGFSKDRYNAGKIIQISNDHKLYFFSDALKTSDPMNWSYIRIYGNLETSTRADLIATIKPGFCVTKDPSLPNTFDPVINGLAYLLAAHNLRAYLDLKSEIPHLKCVKIMDKDKLLALEGIKIIKKS
jgi:hypothetical protein